MESWHVRLKPNIGLFNDPRVKTSKAEGKQSAELRGDQNPEPGISGTELEVETLDKEVAGPDNCENVTDRIQVELLNLQRF